MNKLQEKYGDKGLVIVGVTSENASETEAWVKSNGMKFAFAYDKAKALMRGLKLTSLPSAAVIDPTGTVVYAGSPSRVNEKMIDDHIKAAITVPVGEWPAAAASVKKALKKRKYKTALEAAKKIAQKDESLAGMADSIEAMISGRVANLEAAKGEGNFLLVSEQAKAATKELAGLPALDRVKAIAKEIKSDAAAKRVIKAQKKIAKLREEKLRRPKDFEEAIGKLEKIAKKNAGTYAAKEAEAFIESLRARLKRVRK